MRQVKKVRASLVAGLYMAGTSGLVPVPAVSQAGACMVTLAAVTGCTSGGGSSILRRTVKDRQDCAKNPEACSGDSKQ